MNAAVMAALLPNLRSLKLSAMATNLERQLRQAREEKEAYEEFLLNLTEVEVATRMENGRKRRIREARFPLLKPLETFNFEAAPDLDTRLIKELADGQYIKEARNVIFLGRSGTGKTHLRDEKVLSRTLKRYAGYGLLLIDELGYVPFSKESADLIFQVLTERNERKSVIITTNLGFGDWTQVFGDPTLTAALLDRITHKAHIINCTWESYRLRNTLKKG